MAVQNRIVKVQKRNRALVKFDDIRIRRAILRAAESIGGFRQDSVAGVNEAIFNAHGTDDQIAEFLADAVVVCLNSDPHHLISNFPPTIENIQDEVLHALRSYGFQNTADAYECYRWGRHWLREGAIPADKFMGNGFPRAQMDQTLAWNRQRGCDTVAGLNEIVRSGRIKPLVDESIALYEQSLDEAAGKVLRRLNAGDPLRMMWVSGPSSSGKTTTTVKLTERLQKQGLRFLMLNLDDYFWSLVEHPTDWINDRNYETPEALDIQLLNRHLTGLLARRDDREADLQLQGRPPHRHQAHQAGAGPDSPARLPARAVSAHHGGHPGLGAVPPLHRDAERPVRGRRQHPAPTQFTDVRLLRRMLRDAQHRNHAPLLTILHWHYVRSGELFSIIPLSGLADHVVNGGFPFDLPVLKPFFCGPDGYLPRPEDLQPYTGFLDARIRYERVKRLLDSVEGLSKEQARETTTSSPATR